MRVISIVPFTFVSHFHKLNRQALQTKVVEPYESVATLCWWRL